MMVVSDTNVISELIRPQPHPAVLERDRWPDACGLALINPWDE
jgi:predicted nucleic acid-binding protein